MSEASLIISRCGYSTVMDLAVLKKKSILVPTPGQAEQEYLAKHLMQRNFALCIPQHKFRLEQALDLSANFNYQLDAFTPEDHLDSAIDQFISMVRKGNQ
jgi:UDP-N-acetylglucosamine:LPS N-acetylglucosamine transferase